MKICIAFIYLIVAVVVFLYGIRSANNRSELGKNLTKMLFTAFTVSFSYSLTLITNSYVILSILNSIQFLAIDWLLYFLLYYSCLFTEQKPGLKAGKKLLQRAIVIDNILLITNPFTEWVMSYKKLRPGNESFYIYEPRLWFYLHLGLCYLMVFVTFYVLITKVFSVPGVYKRKYGIVLLCLLLVVAINALFLYADSFLDFSIVTYALVSCLIYYFTFEYKNKSIMKRIRARIFENMSDPVILFDYQGNFSYENKTAEKIFSAGSMKEPTLASFIKKHHLDGHIEEKKNNRFETEIQMGEETIYYAIDYACIRDEKKRFLGSFLLCDDISERKKMMNELIYAANHDVLTGIYNRNFLSQMYFEAKNIPYAITLWNVNGLRYINNFYGNGMGDKVLRQIVRIIEKNQKDTDYLFRLDGDEIMIIQLKTDEKQAVSMMNRIRKEILEQTEIPIEISAEFGVAIMDKEDAALEDCLRQAANTMHQKKMLNQKSVRSSILESLKKSLSESDYETEEHAERTKEMSQKLANKLGLSDKTKGELGLLAILHDIGKVSIPDGILLKPGKLTAEEWTIMQSHTIKGYEIAKITSDLETIAEYILHHHEKWDGSGYPDGLKEKEIPLLSRIITVVDSHDVMTHNRPYHKAISQEEAIKELRRCSGTQFDPYIVEQFIEMLSEETRQAYE